MVPLGLPAGGRNSAPCWQFQSQSVELFRDPYQHLVYRANRRAVGRIAVPTRAAGHAWVPRLATAQESNAYRLTRFNGGRGGKRETYIAHPRRVGGMERVMHVCGNEGLSARGARGGGAVATRLGGREEDAGQ